MRLISLMSPMRSGYPPQPFGLKGIQEWILVAHGCDVPMIWSTLWGPSVSGQPWGPASRVLSARAMRVVPEKVSRFRLAVVAGALGVFSLLAWLISQELWRPAERPGLPVHLAVPATVVSRKPPIVDRSPLSAPTVIRTVPTFNDHMNQPPQQAGDQLAVNPRPRSSARSGSRHSPTHVMPRMHLTSTRQLVGTHRHAHSSSESTLPNWISAGSSTLEDYLSLTGSTDGPGNRATGASHPDPTEWAHHVVNQRITDIPSAFTK
ncbi:hypothetical protein BLA6863_06686 [Burkholderia lata]|uniref:Uncharacterized protein n=1 Tax=Burkholderia lata (strain ATCC 17760 / DSM 23089 / LMG 22485 / NCIMB 9086 / R18194 / 383) TaxID=482957 RepID=A0A6P2RKM2_BURL3|nr:hypothetical protein BLA6863_06686 [Burkholderia lata]